MFLVAFSEIYVFSRLRYRCILGPLLGPIGRNAMSRPKFIELIFIVFLRSASDLRLAKWEAMQDDAKVYFVVHGKLTTTADNNLGKFGWQNYP